MSSKTQIWSKSFPFKPKHNLKSHVLNNKKPFKASFEKEPLEPPSMALILSGEYARIWQKEHCDFVNKKKKLTRGKGNINGQILQRFKNWVQIHENTKTKLQQKRYCCSIGVK